MPPTNEYWKQLWETQIDTLEKLRSHVAAQDVEIAVIKTRIAIYSGMAGAIGGFVGSLLVALIVYMLKK